MRGTHKHTLPPLVLAKNEPLPFAARIAGPGTTTSLDDASQYLFRNSNSFTRMDEILKLRSRMTQPEWLALLGEGWTCSDNLIMYYGQLFQILRTTGPLRAMMTPQENVAYDALSEQITVYRGCGQANMMGMSWSLDKEIANSFPWTNRYKVADPLLVTSTVRGFCRKNLP